MTAKIINLPSPDDDTFPVVSGIPLVDAPAALIARVAANKSWENRAKGFNSFLVESFEHLHEMSEHAMTEDDAVVFIEWVMLKMHERIGQVIDLWGEAKPKEDLAAAIYAVSLNPHHRLEARRYFVNRGDQYLSRQFNQVAARMEALRVFYNLSELSRPGLGHAWRSGVPEGCEARFDMPSE